MFVNPLNIISTLKIHFVPKNLKQHIEFKVKVEVKMDEVTVC